MIELWSDKKAVTLSRYGFTNQPITKNQECWNDIRLRQHCLGGPRFDGETVNRESRLGFTTNHSAIKSFTVRAPTSLTESLIDSPKHCLFYILVENLNLRCGPFIVKCKAPNRSVFLQRISINKSAPGFSFDGAQMKLILDLTGRAGCLICPFCGAGHNDLPGSKIHSNEEPERPQSWPTPWSPCRAHLGSSIPRLVS